MIEKTACQHCGQHIEFDVELANQFIPCPSCARQTRLLMPPSRYQEQRKPRRSVNPWVAWSIIGGLTLAGGLLIYFCTVSGVADAVAKGLGLAGGAIVGLAVLIFGLVVSTLWLLFPVFVYLKMGKMQRTLEQIRDK